MVDFDLSEEHEALVQTARRFTAERITPLAAQCDREARLPMDVFEQAWKIGLVGSTCPAEYGGAGLGALASALIAEELAYGCTGIQASLLANGLALTPIKLAGNEEQKRKYLGMLTSEPVLASYAATEPGAGSDVAGITTRFRRVGDAYVLDGQKSWITNASHARWFVIFATRDAKLRREGIAAFIVDRDSAGLRVGKRHDKLGQCASDTAPVWLEQVVVPKANLLAPEGRGFELATETFDQTRPDIGAAAVGLMRRALDECTSYARERKTFGVPIGQHQLVAAMIAEMAVRVEATRLLVHKAAWNVDRGVRDSIVSSLAKVFGTDSAMATAVDAVQVFGGNGYVKDYPVEKLLRDAKVLQTHEGTSQVGRLVIARQLLG
ncbi:MAG: acyl-CoA dehydrogenase family protein [Polyangiaceae bacterium]|nr:acyl-CoA dehydrogenase family protein [Polyangiaceae bacterium]